MRYYYDQLWRVILYSYCSLFRFILRYRTNKTGTYGMVGINIGGKIDGVVGEFSYSTNPPPPKDRSQTLDVPFTPSSPPKRGTYGIC